MSPVPMPRSVAVIGLGYVGLPLALALSEHFFVVGYDIDQDRVDELRRGLDRTQECPTESLDQVTNVRFSSVASDLGPCDAYFIAVPTPINEARLPDLGPLESATKLVGQFLLPGNLVIYESTVYPGATEEICVPVLERASGLRFNQDFFVGYSPERINPGDRTRTVRDIIKVTSGSTAEAADTVDAIYRKFVHAGTHRAPSIRVAEAAKAVENTQRDINIAFANELTMIFHKLGLDTHDVLEAAGTKWNFMPVRPGLVGGHCIGVDPYYLIHKAESVGASPRLIRAAREINEHMPQFVVGRVVELASQSQIPLRDMDVLILGFTFKEDCADIRNTRIVEIVAALRTQCRSVTVHDPLADPNLVRREYGLEIGPPLPQSRFDAVLVAVPHAHFKLHEDNLSGWLKPAGWILDIKGAMAMSPRLHRLSA